MQFEFNCPLQNHHSFRLKSVARSAVRLTALSELLELNEYLTRTKTPFWVLGQGTNTLFLEDLGGLVIMPALKGVQVFEQRDNTVKVKSAAGEDWDSFVAHCLDQGFYGLEHLSLIPGSVGAAPMQNIGAYGTELDHWVDAVICWDWQTRQVVELKNQACGFDYRTSFFKTHWRARYLILEVVFKLHTRIESRVTYADLKETLGSDCAEPHAVREAVIAIRREKLPDPSTIPNAGSFFKNPVVSKDHFEQLKQAYPNLKGFNVEQGYKLAAGWLLESLGFKGFEQQGVGCYERHALVLVNRMGKREGLAGEQVMAFVDLIKQKVWSVYQITLEVEPNLVTDERLIRLC